MANVRLTDALRSEYQTLFDTCQVSPSKAGAVEAIVDSLLAQRRRYAAVGDPLGIPWQFVAVIHSLECSQNFQQHLHNGDPLRARTRRIPPGRPATGMPPFTWEVSANDALTMKDLDKVSDWSIPGMLYCLEAYNGWGYRRAPRITTEDDVLKASTGRGAHRRATPGQGRAQRSGELACAGARCSSTRRSGKAISAWAKTSVARSPAVGCRSWNCPSSAHAEPAGPACLTSSASWPQRGQWTK